MKKLIPILLFICLVGCKKEKENDPFVLKFQSLLDKYLICDSIKIKSGTTVVVNTIGKGNGEDLKFHSDATYTIYSNPAKTLFFQLTPPDRMYYFPEYLDENTYFKVTSLTGTQLILQKTDPIDSKVYTKYYHVE